MAKTFSMRMADDLYDTVLQYATDECRTMSGAAELLLRAGLRAKVVQKVVGEPLKIQVAAVPKESKAPPKVSVVDPLEQIRQAPLIHGAKCEICGDPVFEDRSSVAVKWKCTNSKKTHTMSPRKIIEAASSFPEDFDPGDLR